MQILLAEDNQVNRVIMTRILEKQGYIVVAVNNGLEAVTAYLSQTFDLILMDIQMPVLDGLEATACIRDQERKTGAHIPIIAVTAHAMTGDRERCLAAGMDGYVTKPIQRAELFKAIMEVTSRGDSTTNNRGVYSHLLGTTGIFMGTNQLAPDEKGLRGGIQLNF